jgi:SAM-dependent methyltransferase
MVALALASAAAALTPAIAESARQRAPRLDVSYEPTPQPAVELMLKLAKVGPDDVVIDLGSGDGRIPITAAKAHGAKGLGIDLDPRRIKEAQANAERAGVADKVAFMEADFFKADLGKATVVTLFLWPSINLRLRPRLMALAPGTRIVSHEHKMGDWQSDATMISKSEEWSDIYLWLVPANIGGTWRLDVDGRSVDATIEQRFQRFRGSAVVDGRKQQLRNGRISGSQVSFELALPGQPKARRYTGRVTADGAIEGEGWQARRP